MWNKIMLSTGSQGQSYWIATWPDDGYIFNHHIDEAGRIYAASYTNAPGYYSALTPLGALVDQYGLANTAFRAVRETGGDVYVCGQSDTGGTANFSKFNASGVLQNAYDLTCSASAFVLYDMAFDGADFLVSGYATISTVVYGVVAKLTTSGAVTWCNKIDSSATGNDYALAIGVDNSDNVYVVGRGKEATYTSAAVLKFNASGTQQWNRILTLASNTEGYGCAVNAGGDVYLTIKGPSNTVYVAKYNTSGTIQWQRKLTVGTIITAIYVADWANNICVDDDGNCYAVFSNDTSVPATYGVDALIVKYNSSGTLQWQRRLGVASSGGYALGIKWKFGSIYVGIADSPGGWKSVIAKLPDDGSLTGTHGAWIYAASDATDAAGDLTDGAGTQTASSLTLTSGADASVQSDPTYTVTTTTVS